MSFRENNREHNLKRRVQDWPEEQRAGWKLREEHGAGECFPVGVGGGSWIEGTPCHAYNNGVLGESTWAVKGKGGQMAQRRQESTKPLEQTQGLGIQIA